MLYPGDLGTSTQSAPPMERLSDEAPVSRTAELLRQTRPWVRFLSVLGFINCGLMVLAGVVMGMVGLAKAQPQAMYLVFVFPVLGLLYFFPSLFLSQYATRIGEFLGDGRQEQLDSALESQKAFWKFMGILATVMLILYAVIIFFGVFAATLVTPVKP